MLLIFKEQHIVLRSETKREFLQAPSPPHTAAHPGLSWYEASGYSIQKGSVSKAACGGFSKQLSLVPIGAWLLSLHTSLKMFPLYLIDICTNLLRSCNQASKSFRCRKKVLAVRKLALFQNGEHLATSCAERTAGVRERSGHNLRNK